MINMNCPYTCIDDTNCNEYCSRYTKMKYLLEHCNVPNYMDAIRYTLSNDLFSKDVLDKFNLIKNNAVSFVEEGKNLYITSPYIQTGKTICSVKIMFKYFDGIWGMSDYVCRGYLVSVQNFLNKFKSFKYRESDEFNNLDHLLKTVDIIIWDGISDWQLSTDEQKLLCLYIKHRLDCRKSNIYNGLSQDDLNDYLGGILAEYINSANQLILGLEE